MKVLLIIGTLLAVSLAQDVGQYFEENENLELSALLNGFEHRIAGGVEAVPHEFPYQAGLFIQLKPEYRGQQKKRTIWCGASIISKDYVITAAHCLASAEFAVVFIGAHDIWGDEPERQRIRVSLSDWTIHPEYDSVYSVNDIALIKLKEPLSFSKTVEPINLPRRSQKSSELIDRLATITGWGRTGDYEDTSDYLRVVYRRIKPSSACNVYYDSLFRDTNICVDGSNRKSVCPGDSGGPLAIDEDGVKTLVGLTSFGREEGCELGYPTSFTRISSYLDWIHSITSIPIRD